MNHNSQFLIEIINFVLNLIIKFFTTGISTNEDKLTGYINNLKNLHLLINLILLLSMNKLEGEDIQDLINNKEFSLFYMNLYLFTKDSFLLYFTQKGFDIFSILNIETLRNLKHKTSKNLC